MVQINFTELKNALSARGFSHETDERLGRWVNRARARLDMKYRWPYRLATTTSIATIADIGEVESVSDTTSKAPLEESSYTDLLYDYSDLTLTGTPAFWYRTSTGVATYPVTTNTVTVRYWKRPSDLTETATPLAPADYHMLIVDWANAMAERDRGNHQVADGIMADVREQVSEMLDDLISQSEPHFMRVTGASVDG